MPTALPPEQPGEASRAKLESELKQVRAQLEAVTSELADARAELLEVGRDCGEAQDNLDELRLEHQKLLDRVEGDAGDDANRKKLAALVRELAEARENADAEARARADLEKASARAEAARASAEEELASLRSATASEAQNSAASPSGHLDEVREAARQTSLIAALALHRAFGRRASMPAGLAWQQLGDTIAAGDEPVEPLRRALVSAGLCSDVTCERKGEGAVIEATLADAVTEAELTGAAIEWISAACVAIVGLSSGAPQKCTTASANGAKLRLKLVKRPQG